jgi:hypothetical protein
MSALFNLLVGGVEAEDIVLNGEAVEEVWVDGIQVFDSYDPAAVPNGTGSTSSATVSHGYNEGGRYIVGGAAKATGSMSIKLNGYTAPNISQRSIDDGQLFSCRLSMIHPKYGEIAAVYCTSVTNNENSFKGRYARAYGAGQIAIQTGAGEIGNYATLAWDFHARTVTVNGSTYSWTPKWREGIYFQYDVQPFSYTDTNGVTQGSTLSATYSITA